jgi:hypothetical protein
MLIQLNGDIAPFDLCVVQSLFRKTDWQRSPKQRWSMNVQQRMGRGRRCGVDGPLMALRYKRGVEL